MIIKNEEIDSELKVLNKDFEKSYYKLSLAKSVNLCLNLFENSKKSKLETPYTKSLI
jgi:hypothetical protein